MQDECLLCSIGRGSTGCHVIYEDDLVKAFLDICPIRPGHTQIISKPHIEYFEGLPPELAARIVQVGQDIAKAMKTAYSVPRVAFLFTGGDLDHTHAHVVPMHEKTDITSRRYIVDEHVTFRSTPRAAESELKQEASRLRHHIS